MTNEEINKAIAEACGWKYWHNDVETMLLHPKETWPESKYHRKVHGMRSGTGKMPIQDFSGLPNYCTDLNAMHEAENKLLTGATGELKRCWLEHLTRAATVGGTSAECATAAQRAEAFLRAIGKWEESERIACSSEKEHSDNKHTKL
jgi:hypothetical protein